MPRRADTACTGLLFVVQTPALIIATEDGMNVAWREPRRVAMP